ncbi:hypothetical protein FB451DRAFT_621506 [Mycena latifolia]|nr:hypothetical protein FB451DRAFT_621506 [Mycena latifolia]
MREDLEARLKADFPALFELGCSCDIGDGWEPLLRRLCVDLQSKPKLRFTQIKEKFGGLRAYMQGDGSIYERVAEAAEESFRTCEKCGEDGRLAATDSGGWYFTTCQECMDLLMANGRMAHWVKQLEDSDS